MSGINEMVVSIIKKTNDLLSHGALQILVHILNTYLTVNVCYATLAYC